MKIEGRCNRRVRRSASGSITMQMTKRKPATVGEILVEEFMQPVGLTQAALAEAMGVQRKHVNELCNHRRNVDRGDRADPCSRLRQQSRLLAQCPAAQRPVGSERERRMIGRQIAIIFGTAVLIPLLIFYGVSTFGSPPKRSDYQTVIAFNASSTPEERAANLEKQKSEQKAFNDAQAQFASRLFWVAAPLGCLALLIGGFMDVSALGTGLIFGGIFGITTGYWTYWEFIPDWERLASLLVAALVLLVIAFRKIPSSGGDSRSA